MVATWYILCQRGLCWGRCLRPLILLSDTTLCPPLPGLIDAASGVELIPRGAELAKADGNAEKRQVLLAQLLVGELVLATKEVNFNNLLLLSSLVELFTWVTAIWLRAYM